MGEPASAPSEATHAHVSTGEAAFAPSESPAPDAEASHSDSQLPQPPSPEPDLPAPVAVGPNGDDHSDVDSTPLPVVVQRSRSPEDASSVGQLEPESPTATEPDVERLPVAAPLERPQPVVARDVERPVAEQPPVRRGLGVPVASLPLTAVQRQVPPLPNADLTGRAESQGRPVPGGETTVEVPLISTNAPMSLPPISSRQRPIQTARGLPPHQGDVTPVQLSGPDPWTMPEQTNSNDDDPVEHPVVAEPLHSAHEPGFGVTPHPVVSVQREPMVSAVPDATFRLPDDRATSLPSRDGAPFTGQRAPEPAVVQRNGARVVGRAEHPVVAAVQRQSLPSIPGAPNTTAAAASPLERLGSPDPASAVERLEMPVVGSPQHSTDEQQTAATAEYAPEPDHAWMVQRSSAMAPTTAAGEVPGLPEQPEQAAPVEGTSAPATAKAAVASRARVPGLVAGWPGGAGPAALRPAARAAARGPARRAGTSGSANGRLVKGEAR